jgi:hypothetical protein
MANNSNQDKQPEKNVENLFDVSKPLEKLKKTTETLPISKKQSGEKLTSSSHEQLHGGTTKAVTRR